MKKYCVMPFVSVRVEDINYDDPRDLSMGFRPCCQYRPQEPISFHSLNEYLESDLLKNLQTHLLTKDTLPKECYLCERDDSTNGRSVRQLKNKFFNNEVFSETSIKELDLFTSNTCNLQCVMCSPRNSSAIGSENTKLKLITKNYNFDETDKSLDTLESLKDLEYVTLAGGEFFYFKHAKRILQKISEIGVPNVKITTNGTVFNPDLIELLKTINNLTIRFSLDGTGTHYEFIRYPAKWNDVTSNIEKFKEHLPHAHFETVIVMLPFSAPAVLEWLDYANRLQLETHWLPSYSPTMNWSMLEPEEIQAVIKKITSEMRQYRLSDNQKINLLTFLKVHIPASKFDPKIRAKVISLLSLKLASRKYPLEDIKQVTNLWPKFQKELLENINQVLSS